MSSKWGCFITVAVLAAPAYAEFVLLDPDDFKPLFKDGKINASSPDDQGPVNEAAFQWAKDNVPFFECDDKDIEASYAFRWRAYFTHIVPTGYPRNPWVVTECYSPTIPGRCDWGKPFGTINAAAGHHIREGRWIRDPIYIDSYSRFWFNIGNHYANGTTSGSGSLGYSHWIQHAIWSRAHVTNDVSLFSQSDTTGTLLESMIKSFEQDEKNSRVDLNPKNIDCTDCPKCYYKPDGFDAMEGSISGNGCRPSNNAMFYGNSLAIANIAAAVGNRSLATEWAARAAEIRTMYLSLLWNSELNFFSVYKDGSPARVGQANETNGLPFGFPNDICGIPDGSALPAPPPPSNTTGHEWWRTRPYGCPPTSSWHDQYKYANQTFACNATVGVRELLGLGPPWYFELPPATSPHTPDPNYLQAWEQLFDPEGFQAKWGPTTAEQRHRCFNWSKTTDECNWAAPSWPYETSRVLTGLSNVLNNYPAASSSATDVVDKAKYTALVRQYAVAHTQSHAANSSSPYIGENIEPHDGYWIARQIMYGDQPVSHGGYAQYENATADKDRSVDYNHSTFADLIIEGLVGLRAMFGALFFIVNPLAIGFKYFALDNVAYHNHNVSIAWDEDGTRNYTGCKKGMCVFVDGDLRASSPMLMALNVSLTPP